MKIAESLLNIWLFFFLEDEIVSNPIVIYAVKYVHTF